MAAVLAEDLHLNSMLPRQLSLPLRYMLTVSTPARLCHLGSRSKIEERNKREKKTLTSWQIVVFVPKMHENIKL